MKHIWNFLRILLAIFIVYAGIQHFIKPDFFNAFVPDFLIYKSTIIYVSGIIEIVLGVLLLIPKYTRVAASGILILMLLFLPIHIWDVITDTPAIGSHEAAVIRLPMQFVLIALAYKFRKTNNNG
ncbi:DoxX family membrane protein [Tenacibaculum sp. AHE15PA]|uniref:DoxX family protein n=1 Tax=unclassified Tenacibaculum TaxID=2635139 RepID=UPI001C4FBF58|nr:MULTISPECIES: MauE/DoxX family redox-associated membrane protein [unclassified Tenacibaculum]QXP73816.1 DoxX family membrane protein [Tenacibaculum sp. AHE14PA]QXP75817.1 DoxX family membrane protein [Tenacibaculum sp. AHE15PA]